MTWREWLIYASRIASTLLLIAGAAIFIALNT